MTILPTALDAHGPEYAANRAAMLAKLDELEAAHAQALAGGGEKYVTRHRKRGKLTARERIELLVDPDTPFLELSPPRRLGQRLRGGRLARHRDRGGRGRGVPDHRQRPDRTRRGLQPVDAEEGPARQRDRLRQPAPLHQPRGVRRRRPAVAEGDLHPRRGPLPRHHPALRRRNSHRRRRVRQLHRRRRVRPRHVRPRRDDQGALQGLPRRAAPGEDGDRRGERRRIARRGRDARPHLRARRPLRRGRARRAPTGPPHRRPPQLAQDARRSGARRTAEVRRGRTARHRPRRPQGPLRPPARSSPDWSTARTSTPSNRCTGRAS